MTCHLCAKQNCIGECEPKVTPMAWKRYTRALERRLEHLETKAHKNSFDKHEASALRHVLGIVKQSQRQWVGLTDDEVEKIWRNLPYEVYGKEIRMIEQVIKDKNT